MNHADEPSGEKGRENQDITRPSILFLLVRQEKKGERLRTQLEGPLGKLDHPYNPLKDHEEKKNSVGQEELPKRQTICSLSGREKRKGRQCDRFQWPENWEKHQEKGMER